MSELPDRRSVLRGALVGVTVVLAGCSADPYRRTPEGDGATTGAMPGGADGRRVEFQGTTYVVPQTVTRVVTIGDACLQAALDVGAPVVATSAVAPATVPPSRRAALRALPVLGSGRVDDPVTVDQVSEQRPDVVLAAAGTSAALVEQVGARVPVVVVRTGGDHRFSWQDRVEGIGALLGVADAAAPGRAFREHLDRVRERHAQVAAEARVVVMRAWDTTRISAYGPGSVAGDILHAAGARFVPVVTTPQAVAARGEVTDALANVETYLRDADVIMLASDYAGGLDAFTGGSLATSDPVTGHVRETGAVLMGAGVLTVTNYAAAHYMLDRFDEALTALAARR